MSIIELDPHLFQAVFHVAADSFIAAAKRGASNFISRSQHAAGLLQTVNWLFHFPLWCYIIFLDSHRMHAPLKCILGSSTRIEVTSQRI
jgi:hypothetical protein